MQRAHDKTARIPARRVYRQNLTLQLLNVPLSPLRPGSLSIACSMVACRAMANRVLPGRLARPVRTGMVADIALTTARAVKPRYRM